MQRYLGFIIAIVLILGAITTFSGGMPKFPGKPPQHQVAAAIVTSPFSYSFKVDGTLHETGSISESSSPYWWLNSGGKMILDNESGQTIFGSLPSTDSWRLKYAIANPVDTDNGTHPQNIFRLVSRSTWNDVRLESDFYIGRDNLSSSPNRNQSNGILFMSRYTMGGQTLYYAGIRVDGTAVIKKKYNGTYYTMTQPVVFSGTYDRSNKPNLLPKDTWIRLRLDTKTNSDGSVSLTLSMKNPVGSTWKQIASAKDSGNFGDTPPITGARYMGIRTDFMDVKFDNFLAQNL